MTRSALKTLLAATLACGLMAGSAHASNTQTYNNYMLNLDTIKLIECARSFGSGTVIGHNKVLTAAHVVYGNTSCKVGAQMGVVSAVDSKDDIAIITVELGERQPVSKVSCDGYKPDQGYFAFGYAEASDFAMQFIRPQLDHPRDAPTKEPEGFQGVVNALTFAQGWVRPGMSGGPIVDVSGDIVGMVNASAETFMLTRDLSETQLCTFLRYVAPPVAVVKTTVKVGKLTRTPPALNQPGLPSIADLLAGAGITQPKVK